MNAPAVPISTLTGEPCRHGPGKCCIECVGEGEFRFEPLGPDTEEETR